jgi:hypothetical protein
MRLAMLKNILRKKKKRDDNDDDNNNQPPQKLDQRLQQVADYQPGECLKRTQIFILLMVLQKVSKK